MFIEIETQEQKELRHRADNYMSEFLRANGKAESIARDAGYKPETKTDTNGNPVIGSNGKPVTLGVVQALARDLKRTGDLTAEEANILIIGKKERNGGLAHADEVSTETMSVSKENFEKFNSVV